MREDKLLVEISEIKKRAGKMQNGAAFLFLIAMTVLFGAGYLFYTTDISKPSSSTVQFGIQMVFSLFSRLGLIVVAFYLVRLLMSVVSYNLALSNDLYSKAASLSLYRADGSLTLSDLNEHLSINHHTFEASKGFSGKDEVNTLMSALKAKGAEPRKQSDQDAKKLE